MPPATWDMASMSDHTTLEKNGGEVTNMLGNQRPRNTKRDGIQQEGLVYEIKKVIIKHDRGLLAWMKAGKRRRIKLAAGS